MSKAELDSRKQHRDPVFCQALGERDGMLTFFLPKVWTADMLKLECLRKYYGMIRNRSGRDVAQGSNSRCVKSGWRGKAGRPSSEAALGRPSSVRTAALSSLTVPFFPLFLASPDEPTIHQQRRSSLSFTTNEAHPS